VAKINFMGKEFKTQSDFKDHVRIIVRNMANENNGIINPGTSSYTFLTELLKRHPKYEEKISKPFTGFKVIDWYGFDENGGWGSPRRRHIQTRFIREKRDKWDFNNTEPFSWTSCISGKPKSHRHNLMSAFRRAIAKDIARFREVNPVSKCSACETPLTAIQADVDHVYEFRKIVDEFLAINPNHPDSFDEDEEGGVVFRKDNDPYKKMFREFHESKASYRYLCQPCNWARNKRKSPN